MKRHFLKILAVSTALSTFISSVAYAGTWTTESGQWKYRQDDGTYAEGRLRNTDGRWHYFDVNGRMLSDIATPGGYQVREDGAWVNHDPCASYDADYPLEDYANKAGLRYVDVIMSYNSKGDPVMERRLRQDYSYGLYNCFGLSDNLCKTLYGESDQIGTGEVAVDGDSLLVLAGVPLYQEGVGSDIYRQQHSRIALVIREYLNSYQWRNASEPERARNAAFYVASGCTYDKDLYNRFVAGKDTTGGPSFTAYGCLVSHKAVHEGISVAYQLLARSMGLNCFCAPDDEDKGHMFVYVQADGNRYKVDLPVTGLVPQAMVRRCFTSTANQEVKRIMKAYYNEENPHIKHIQYGSLAPGAVCQLKGGWQYREYQ